jgi:hypothetical protein
MEIGAEAMTPKVKIHPSQKIIFQAIIPFQTRMIPKVSLKIPIMTIQNTWILWIIQGRKKANNGKHH